MIESVRQRHENWQLARLLQQYPTLRIVPSGNEDLVVSGRLPFDVIGPDEKRIADEYKIELSVPPEFPRDLPLVKETEGSIPKDYHKLEGDFLCLGTPTQQRLVLVHEPTLPAFVATLVIPYLYGYSYYERNGTMPFGEESHGDQGIRDQLAQLYHAPAITGVEEFLRLTGLRKRVANKRPCPCQSGRRLGRCHNRVVNALRARLGRLWFRDEYERVCEYLQKPEYAKHRSIGKAPSLRELLNAQLQAGGVWQPESVAHQFIAVDPVMPVVTGHVSQKNDISDVVHSASKKSRPPQVHRLLPSVT